MEVAHEALKQIAKALSPVFGKPMFKHGNTYSRLSFMKPRRTLKITIELYPGEKHLLKLRISRWDGQPLSMEIVAAAHDKDVLGLVSFATDQALIHYVRWWNETQEGEELPVWTATKQF